MSNAARDLRYGRRGGRWADTWTEEDEDRYLAALNSRPEHNEENDAQLRLFGPDDPPR